MLTCPSCRMLRQKARVLRLRLMPSRMIIEFGLAAAMAFRMTAVLLSDQGCCGGCDGDAEHVGLVDIGYVVGYDGAVASGVHVGGVGVGRRTYVDDDAGLEVVRYAEVETAETMGRGPASGMARRSEA